MDLAPGQLLLDGRFALVREIGRGGTGRVWEARAVADGRVVAIKCMPAEQGGRVAVEREAEVAVRVRHPALVRVLLTHEEADRALVVMERCESSLATRVALDGPLSPRAACLAMVPVLDALAAAHAAGVVHRDVKPHNVLLRADGSTALGDWGIARALFAGSGAATTSIALLGTLPFLAPELRRDARAASPASDLYAAGVTLAWICLGAPPEDPSVPEGADSVRAALPPAVADIVLRACAWSPVQRYESAAAMRDALRDAADATEDPVIPGAGGSAPRNAFMRRPSRQG
jgi:serine/threonine protein kinase